MNGPTAQVFGVYFTTVGCILRANRREDREKGSVPFLTGHLFQGRSTAILVDADAHLLELARYVVLNPVRTGMVDDPKGCASAPHRCYSPFPC